MQVENVRTARPCIAATNESRGSVLHVLKIRRAAEANVKWNAEHGSFHRFGWIARQTRVAVYSVHGQWPQPDAVNSVIQKVHARVTFVRAFENTIMSCRLRSEERRVGKECRSQ